MTWTRLDRFVMERQARFAVHSADATRTSLEWALFPFTMVQPLLANLDGAAGWVDVAGRLAAAPRFLGQHRTNLTVALVDGWRPDRATVENAVDRELPGALAYLAEELPALPARRGHRLDGALGARLAAATSAARDAWARMVNVEGWAVHAEELMRREGFFEPLAELFVLEAHAVRAGRVVADLRFHRGEWSRAEVRRFLRSEVGLTEEMAAAEALRYGRIPLQATTSLVGRWQIEQLRAARQVRLGDDFDLADFHDWLFAFGPIAPRALASVHGDMGSWMPPPPPEGA